MCSVAVWTSVSSTRLRRRESFGVHGIANHSSPKKGRWTAFGAFLRHSTKEGMVKDSPIFHISILNLKLQWCRFDFETTRPNTHIRIPNLPYSTWFSLDSLVETLPHQHTDSRICSARLQTP